MRYAIQQASEVMVVNPTLPYEKSFITGNIHTAPAMIIIIPNMLLPFSESSPAAVTLAFFTSKYARDAYYCRRYYQQYVEHCIERLTAVSIQERGIFGAGNELYDSHYSEDNSRNRSRKDSFLSERKPFIITPFNCS